MQIQNVYLLTRRRQRLNTLVCMIGCTFHAFQLKNDQLVASHLLQRLQFERSKKTNKNNNKSEYEGEATCQVQSATRWGVDGLLLLLTACAPSSLIKLKVAAGVTALPLLQRRKHATALAPHLQSCAAARYALPARLDASAPSAADVSVRPGGEDEGLLAPQRGAAAQVLQAKSPGKLADALQK